MVDSTVSALQAAAALSGAELLYAVQGGADRKLRVDEIRPQFSYVSGNFYQGNYGVVLSAGAALAADTIRAVPFVIHSRVTISQLAVRITTLSAGGNIQLAIYANDPALGKPTGAAVCSTGNISTAYATIVAANLAGGNATLDAGVYWLCVNSDNSVVVCQTYAVGQVIAGYLIGSSTAGGVAGGTATGALTLSLATQTFGSWPNLTVPTFTAVATLSYAIPIFKVA